MLLLKLDLRYYTIGRHFFVSFLILETLGTHALPSRGSIPYSRPNGCVFLTYTYYTSSSL